MGQQQRAISFLRVPEAADLEPMREACLDDHEILEAVQVIGMFNMTNRVSSALGMVPNHEYHSQAR
ncbi:hypothetical protein [Janibacter hoylei]|uniref:Peroxidase n=1 Tax=Janibacter hoylei PVAS-1 TaxID=1210046 RepID=K1E9X5_9MICO|nr:hypothetical protein [Janibacter hoylei]EKA62212.1 peroxidase [Janibacter hoylei PVAS-1]MCT1618611.1 hypothetical protein [Janibacter hoylei]MCT2291912.1 hypothetical protein [Janibacter hoylei]MCW4602812.1 hypothetical protein [Janibacter hoylei]